jgi:hypothetical protein
MFPFLCNSVANAVCHLNLFYINLTSYTQNGENKGLKVILDTEAYDYAYFPRASKGFKISLADARDKAVVNQDGYFLSPGK